MAMPISVPSYTVDDLDRFPPDGNRYELLEGMLLVTPAPGLPHQVVTQRLAASAKGTKSTITFREIARRKVVVRNALDLVVAT